MDDKPTLGGSLHADGSHPVSGAPTQDTLGLVGAKGARIINFRPATEFRIDRRRKDHCRCSVVGEKYPSGELPSTWIDEATRDLECKKCGARLDPFDYLWTLATEGDSLTRDLRDMREGKKALKAQIELLHEQIRELKAEGRKLAKAPKSVAGGGGAEQAGDGNTTTQSRAGVATDRI